MSSITKLHILAYDKTGGWNVDHYSAQKGHSVCFRTNICDANIAKIVWLFGDNSEPSTEKRPCHIFQSQFDTPGEGFATVSVVVTTNNQKCLRACRRMLIAPVVDCDMAFEDYEITCDTKYIELHGFPLCAALACGEPLEGSNIEYACGGACDQDCPRCEIQCSPLCGTKIAWYGKHCITSDCNVHCEPDANWSCVPLYSENQLGKTARYPPIKKWVRIVPRNLWIQVHHASSQQQRWHKKFVIRNLSQHMLPDSATVSWRIFDQCGRIYWRCTNQCKTLCYEFRCSGHYCIEAVVDVSPDCEPVTVKVFLFLSDCCGGDDVVVQPPRDAGKGLDEEQQPDEEPELDEAVDGEEEEEEGNDEEGIALPEVAPTPPA